jgi:hypothetical protein
VASPPTAFGPGLTRYRLRRNPLTHVIEKALREEVGVVHALSLDPSEAGLQIPEPQFLEKRLAREAACGTEIRVIMPGTFDPAQSDACPTCAGEVSSGSAYGTPGLHRVDVSQRPHQEAWDGLNRSPGWQSGAAERLAGLGRSQGPGQAGRAESAAQGR